jgi:Recombination endonuclease VII
MNDERRDVPKSRSAYFLFREKTMKKQTHCKRGHPRTSENLIGRSCKTCTALHNRQWRIEHPEETRRHNLESSRRKRFRSYNLTDEQYAALYVAQKGLCILPSCGKPIEVIDHDHVRGKTRGLMCDRHNVALGGFSDNPQLLREAAEYLENFNGQQ